MTRVLADRLERVIGKVIHPAQIGFIRGRYLYSNFRRVFNVIYRSYSNITPEVIVSLETQKAFDQIKHKFLLFALKSFGCGPFLLLLGEYNI